MNEKFCELYFEILLQKYPEIIKLINNIDKGFVQSKGHIFLNYEVCGLLEKLNYSQDKIGFETQINSIESIDYIDDDDISNHFLFGLAIAMKIKQVWKLQALKKKLIVYVVPTDEKWMLIRCHEYLTNDENYYQLNFNIPIFQTII